MAINFFYVPAAAAQAEFIEKRSRFRGELFKVDSAEKADEILQSRSKLYPDARHHCWAMRLHGKSERSSDDGEPQGTAGKPILETLAQNEIENALIVVTRWFGGILLGAGGLTRAYRKAAADALRAGGKAICKPFDIITFSCPYSLLGKVESTVPRYSAAIEERTFGESVLLSISVPEETADALLRSLSDLSSGVLQPLSSSCEMRDCPL